MLYTSLCLSLSLCVHYLVSGLFILGSLIGGFDIGTPIYLLEIKPYTPGNQDQIHNDTMLRAASPQAPRHCSYGRLRVASVCLREIFSVHQPCQTKCTGWKPVNEPSQNYLDWWYLYVCVYICKYVYIYASLSHYISLYIIIYVATSDDLTNMYSYK